MLRSLAFGVTASVVLLWLMFFAGPGTVEVATLAAAVATLVWFATVDTRRLVDQTGRPQLLMFLLALLGIALLVTAATFISSGTSFVTLAVGTAALVTGVTRAVRRTMHSGEE